LPFVRGPTEENRFYELPEGGEKLLSTCQNIILNCFLVHSTTTAELLVRIKSHHHHTLALVLIPPLQMNTMSDDSSYHSHSHDEDCDDMHEAAGACNDSSHSSSGKRKIVSNACEFCKKRKIKCDGSFPCFQCTKRKINCEFHPRAAKRGPKSSHKRSKISEQELSELKSSNSQLKIDLEVQKRLVEYLQQQLQQSGTSIPISDPASSRIAASVKPRFNADSEIFLASRVNAMKAAITNFQHAIALFMDHYKFHGNSEFALQMWNYLLESTPEQLNNRFQGESLEQLSTLYEHCVVFMHGTC
jgi:predicted small metal-binding protein